MLKILIVIISILLSSQQTCEPYAPRLSLGRYYNNDTAIDNMITIQFNTQSPCPTAQITVDSTKYTVHETTEIDMAQIYEDFTPEHSFQHKYDYTYKTYVQTFTIGNLKPGWQYKYTIQGNDTVTPINYLFTLPEKHNKVTPTRVVLFGDMDTMWDGRNASQDTINWLQNSSYKYDAWIYLGDMGYDLESDDCQRGDNFLRNLSASGASIVPFLTTPGNHDSGNNTEYILFRNFFNTPSIKQLDTTDNFINFYTYDLGYAHFISFNPYKIIYENDDDTKKIIEEYLKADLEDLNRIKTPWIVVYSHYPMYCSDTNDDQCMNNAEKLGQIRQILEDEGVQFYISAHQHSYERISHITNMDTGDTLNLAYFHKGHPIYIVDGTAGSEQLDKTYPIQSNSLFLSYENSVGVLSIFNQTDALFQQIRTSNDTVIDYLIVKQDFIPPPINKPQSKVWYFITAAIAAVVVIVVIFGVIQRCRGDKEQDQQKQPLMKNEVELQPA